MKINIQFRPFLLVLMDKSLENLHAIFFLYMTTTATQRWKEEKPDGVAKTAELRALITEKTLARLNTHWKLHLDFLWGAEKNEIRTYGVNDVIYQCPKKL